MVKCLYCGKSFDINQEPFCKPRGNRYAHIQCEENKKNNTNQDIKDEEELSEYITKLFNEPYLSPRIQKQLKKYRDEYQYTNSGMLKALKWWYEVRHNDIEKANKGVGILPYIYQQAYDYYYTIYQAQQINEGKLTSQIKEEITREFNIEAPKPKRRLPRLFKFKEEGGGKE